FYNVELNGTSATLSTNAIDIDGDFTITSGTWDTGGNDMYVAGNWTNNDTFNRSYALSFTGSSEYLNPNVDIDLGTTWTIETWFKYPLEESSHWRTLTRGTAGDHQVIIASGAYDLGTYDTTGGTGFRDSGFDVNVLSVGWHHLAAVQDGTDILFYIDGSLAGTVLGYISTTEITAIGNYQGGGQEWGTIDEFRVLNRALTLTEIQEDYSALAPYPARSGTLAWYHMDENTGSSVYDSSGNGYTGTLAYTPTWTTGIGLGTGTVTFDGTSTVGGAAVDTFYNLNVADSGQTTTLNKNITVDNDFTVGDGTYNGAFTTTLRSYDYPIVVSPGATISDGTLEIAPSADFYGFGSFISANLNHLQVNSPMHTITMTDDVNCNGNLDVTAGTLNTGSGCDLDIGGSITIGGTLTAADPQSYIYCEGNWTNNGTFNPGSGTVTFAGSGSLISGGTSAGPFYNLIVSSGTRDVTTNSVKVNGQLTINSGASFQIATGGLNLHTGQSVDLDGTLSLDPSSGSGGIYWYVEEDSLVDLDSGGTLTLDGFDDGNRVYLRSSADGNPWYLNDNTSAGNNPFIDYVDVKDSDASGGNIIDASGGTNVDSGNNPNWLFTYTIFVDANAPAPGPGDGTSWYDAYKYLQDALAEANSVPKPVEVWVAEQTCTPDTNFANQAGSGDRQATFQLLSNVGIYGGFPSGGGSWAQRKPQLYETTLSGDLDSNDVQGLDPCDLLDHLSRAENSFHVVTANDVNSGLLDGFIIHGGNANGVPPDCNGGGLFSVDSNITVANCSFSECSASSGGAITCILSDIVMNNLMLTANYAAIRGGSIYIIAVGNSRVDSCTVVKNSAGSGGGMYNKDSNSVVTGCSFIGNSAVLGDGAGIYNKDSNSVVTGCTFIGNSAIINGGAMIVEGLGSITKLANCTFSGNDANTGGGIAKIGPSPPTYLTNCILWGNTAYYGSKQDQQIFLGPGTYINYSCVEGWTGGFGGTGNIGDDPNNDDPDFVREPNDGGDGWGVGDNDDYGDLHLVPGWPGSACINTGDPCDANYIGQVDIDGDPRVSDGRVDMGSDEVIWDGATGISPDANIILNPGGGPNDLNTEALVLFDNNSAGDANIIVVEMSRPVYPSEGYFEVLGTTLRIDTTLSDGEFSAIIVIPFDSNDLAGADPCKLNLMYYDAVSKAWKLAVAGNTGADPIGTRWLELAPSDPPPTWETLESRSLGDYGTYWEPSTTKGIVWAYVDHFTDFSAAGHGIPDFEPDGDVDMVDFAFFAEWWQESGCGICGGVELTGDGSVGFDDLRELADNWLAGK
ncbi:MAG: hypothetical protein JSV99_09335, partial [Planctomycetota bacterium]